MRTLVGFLILFTPALVHAGKTYNEGSGGTWDCKKDPSVTINTNDATYTLKGACTSISINGNTNKLTIESVDRLAINGNDNTIDADSAARIAANGNGNQVTYKKGTPKISNLGTGNRIGNGGANKPADKQKPDADADAGGDSSVIDCAKHPIQSIASTGDNALKYVGTCTKITVMTGSNRLSIENVKTLELDGGENTVEIGGVDAIVMNGAENRVTYRKGLSGAKPRISGAGAENKVVQIK
ncbi:MAG TPA: DUF3060 domain-containing protein [Kofleriaceae bacterium]|jgi:hypothetical protein|nr:DUF3060 domain-containing protein [Kofleriaceae bacterium]